MWNVGKDANFELHIPDDFNPLNSELRNNREDSLSELFPMGNGISTSSNLNFRNFCFVQESFQVFIVVRATEAAMHRDREIRKVEAIPVSSKQRQVSISSATWFEYFKNVDFILSEIDSFNVDRPVELVEVYPPYTLLFSFALGAFKTQNMTVTIRVRAVKPHDSISIQRNENTISKVSCESNTILEEEQAKYRYPLLDPMMLTSERQKLDSLKSIYALQHTIGRSSITEKSSNSFIFEKNLKIKRLFEVKLQPYHIGARRFFHCVLTNVCTYSKPHIHDIFCVDKDAEEFFKFDLHDGYRLPVILGLGESYDCCLIVIPTKKSIPRQRFETTVCVTWSYSQLHSMQVYKQKIQWDCEDSRDTLIDARIETLYSNMRYMAEIPFQVKLKLRNDSNKSVNLEIIFNPKSTKNAQDNQDGNEGNKELLCVPHVLYRLVNNLRAQETRTIVLSFTPLTNGFAKIGNNLVIRDQETKHHVKVMNNLVVYVGNDVSQTISQPLLP